MNDAPVVRELLRAGEDFDQARGAAGRPGRPGEVMSERPALDILEGQIGPAVRLADLEDLHDVRMLQRGDRLGFTAKTLAFGSAGVSARQDHLQRHQAVQVLLTGLVDHPHAAPAQLALDFVTRHRMSHRGGRRRGGLCRRAGHLLVVKRQQAGAAG